MNRVVKLALAALCAALLLVVAAELFQLENQNSPPSAAEVTTGIKTSVPPLDLEAAVAEILERPLFSPARRAPEALSAANLEGTVAESPPSLTGRLAGVMIRPEAREALFVRAGQKPFGVKVGGEIDGWRILAIERDRVILSSDFGTQTIRPTKGPEIVRAPARATGMALGMGPPTNSTTAGAGASVSPQSTGQVEKWQ